MTALSLALTALLAVLAVTVVPRRAAANVEALRRALPDDPGARLRLYRRFVLSGSVLTTIAAVVVAVGGKGFRAAGLAWPPGATGRCYAVTLAGLAGYLVVMLAVTRFAGGDTAERTRIVLPESAAERRTWPAVALTAGVSEEAVYRGLFVLHAHALVPGARPALLAVGAAVLFGAGHRYQGWLGVVGSTLLGLVFGAVAVATESVYGVVALHAAWDVLAGWAGVVRTRTS